MPSCRHIALMGWDLHFLALKLTFRNGSVLTINALPYKNISAAVQGSVLWTQQKANSSLSCSLHSFLFHLRFLSDSEPVPKDWENWKMWSVATTLHQVPKSAFTQTWCNLNSVGLLCKCAHISVTLSTYSGILPRRWGVTIFIPMESSKSISSTLSLCSNVCTRLSSGKIN